LSLSRLTVAGKTRTSAVIALPVKRWRAAARSSQLQPEAWTGGTDLVGRDDPVVQPSLRSDTDLSIHLRTIRGQMPTAWLNGLCGVCPLVRIELHDPLSSARRQSGILAHVHPVPVPKCCGFDASCFLGRGRMDTLSKGHNQPTRQLAWWLLAIGTRALIPTRSSSESYIDCRQCPVGRINHGTGQFVVSGIADL
jgi:hypothetical protein